MTARGTSDIRILPRPPPCGKRGTTETLRNPGGGGSLAGIPAPKRRVSGLLITPVRSSIKLNMAKVLSTAQRVQIVSALVEGNSLRATARMAGVSGNTVNKLLLDLGAACAAQQGESIGKLQTRRVEVDEIWSFVGMKKANLHDDAPEVSGEV
jgi:hypothetical protein